MSASLEKKVLTDLAMAARPGLVHFMAGFSDEVLRAYYSADLAPVSISNWVDNSGLFDLLGSERGVYYTKWFTTLLKLSEEGMLEEDIHPFDRINAALQTTGLYRLGEPLTIYMFEGNYYLTKTNRYEQSYGSQKLCYPRYTTAAML